MYANHTSLALRTVVTMAVGMMIVGPARAEVLETTAQCQSKVTELLGGQPGIEDSALERYPETTSVLPMSAEAGITNESAGPVGGIGLCFTQFKDPRASSGPVPDELNIDAATYSGQADLSYEVNGLVDEHRQIRPTAGETGLADGEEVELTSNFYIQGLLVAVARTAGGNLSGLLARVQATVVHERPGQSPQTVMTATYELVGQADGSVTLATAGEARSSHALDLDLSEFVGDFELLRTAILPAVKISYRYTATVGAVSRLTATLRVKLVNLPDGTGVGAAFGLPGEKIGQAIDAVEGTSAGAQAVQAINSSIASLPSPAIDFLRVPSGSSGGIFGGCCGLFGIEIAMGLAMMLGWVGTRTRRG